MHKIPFKYQYIKYQGTCAVEFCLLERSITLDTNTKTATVGFNNKIHWKIQEHSQSWQKYGYLHVQICGILNILQLTGLLIHFLSSLQTENNQ